MEVKSSAAEPRLSNGTGREADAVDEQLRALLIALQAMKVGDFSARLPSDWTGVMGKVADTFNDIGASNQRMAAELERIGYAVGREGHTKQRVKFVNRAGAWGEMEGSVNTLIDDLLWPTDEMIRAVGANGGVVMINFGSAFLTEASNKASRARWDAVKAFRKANGIAEDADDDPRVKAFSEQYRKDHPPVFATLDDVVAHIDHAVRLAGIDHVGLGSDFDGVGDSLPEGLKDVSGYPNLIDALLAKGYTETDIEKICGGNLLRVWNDVEAAARSLSADQNR